MKVGKKLEGGGVTKFPFLPLKMTLRPFDLINNDVLHYKPLYHIGLAVIKSAGRCTVVIIVHFVL